MVEFLYDLIIDIYFTLVSSLYDLSLMFTRVVSLLVSPVMCKMNGYSLEFDLKLC